MCRWETLQKKNKCATLVFGALEYFLWLDIFMDIYEYKIGMKLRAR